MILFYIYITIDNIFYIFLKILGILYFYSKLLVQFCIILVKNVMFYLKKHIIKFGYEFLVCNRYCVYLLMKTIDKNLIHFCDAT